MDFPTKVIFIKFWKILLISTSEWLSNIIILIVLEVLSYYIILRIDELDDLYQILQNIYFSLHNVNVTKIIKKFLLMKQLGIQSPSWVYMTA